MRAFSAILCTALCTAVDASAMTLVEATFDDPSAAGRVGAQGDLGIKDAGEEAKEVNAWSEQSQSVPVKGAEVIRIAAAHRSEYWPVPGHPGR